jgi:hypothetical protein
LYPIDVKRAALDEPCHVAISELGALFRQAIREGFVAKLVEVLKIGFRLLAAEESFRSVGVKSGAVQFDRELLETKRMAPSSQVWPRIASVKTSALWLFTILRKPTYSRYENVFSQRA